MSIFKMQEVISWMWSIWWMVPIPNEHIDSKQKAKDTIPEGSRHTQQVHTSKAHIRSVLTTNKNHLPANQVIPQKWSKQAIKRSTYKSRENWGNS